METSTLSKEKYEMYSFQEKGGIGKSNGAKSSAQGDKKKSLKERLILNGTKGLVISEQDPTHLSFQFVKRN